MEGLARRPVAYTCAPVLELPNSYRNFYELREEFTSILNAGNMGTDSVKIVEVGLKLKREGNHLFLASVCAYFILLSMLLFFHSNIYCLFCF